GYQQKGSPRFQGEAGNALMIGIIVVVVAVGAYLIWSSQKSGQEATNTNTAEEADNGNANDSADSNVNDEQSGNDGVNVNVDVNMDNGNANVNANVNAEVEVKTFTVGAENFSFNPAEIRVKKGDRVRIVFNNNSGFHDWVLDEFNVRTKQMQGPATETVEFTADKTGTFEYYCSVGTHRAMGMKGNLIVE
ncbi:MAG: cupredoxin domain-containing protein, partial [Candidatus Komeilibacteria bacterium]|nr:cupredoxin domain-containing protein [Candidatus Komeilibacteria bacterium]